MFRINEFLNFESEIVEGETKDFQIEGTIEFRNVTFVYENTGIKAIDNVSFILNKGETLAILGKTGSGKSTIALLITRSLEPTSGEIINKSNSFPNLRWSRCFASSRIFRNSAKSFLLKNAVPYTRCIILLSEFPRQYAPANDNNLNT